MMTMIEDIILTKIRIRIALHLTTAGNISSKHEVQSPDLFQVNLPESICQHQSCLM